MARKLAPLLVLVVASAACIESPQVVEGTVTSLDQTAKTVTVADSRLPDHTVTLSLEGADIGAPPAPGDTVRIAYVERANGHTALRVMNVSRQAEQTGSKH